MKKLQGLAKAMGLTDEAGQIILSTLLIYLWVLKVSIDQELTPGNLIGGLLALATWNIQKFFDVKRTEKISANDREFLEKLDGRLSQVESIVTVRQQREMF